MPTDTPVSSPSMPIAIPNQEAPSASKRKPRFAPKSPFAEALRKQEAAFFSSHNLSRHDQPQIYIKTLTLFLWLGASYGLFLAFALPWWGVMLLAVSAGFALAGIGFNVMHDGGHNAYSKQKWINRLMFASLEFLGGSNHFWHWKHNHLHHSYTNIDEHDSDLEVGLLARLSPHQTHLPFHRFQHLYMWFFYGFLCVKWQLFDDYHNLIVGRVGKNTVPRPKGWALVQFFVGKAVFMTWMFAIPLLFHTVGMVLLFYFTAAFVQGLILAVVFQMAHCVEEASFPKLNEAADRIQADWYQHQAETTVNFAPHNRLVTWYCGGLNHQIEHHLFPRVSHIHYPALSQVVKQTCEEHQIPYLVQPTLRKSLRSHYRWLKRMGQPTPS